MIRVTGDAAVDQLLCDDLPALVIAMALDQQGAKAMESRLERPIPSVRRRVT